MCTFKNATAEDIPLIRELAEKSWNSAYKNILSKEQIFYMLQEMYSEEEISRQLQNPNYVYFLISDGNENAGFIGFEYQFEEKTTKLHRIYLLEEFKGKGLGKKALQFLKLQVQQNGDTRIILNVNKSNPAIEIYESQGFKIYEEGVFDIGNGFVMDDYLMECFIN
ncbi:GNAT family N-acetyltransferase [Kaistella solincola]|nr:GNAT family N-acetyltransferase [Kaistella solincola]